MKSKFWRLAAAVLIAFGVIAFWRWRQPAFTFDPSLEATLNGITRDYRQIIAVVEAADTLDVKRKPSSTTRHTWLYIPARPTPKNFAEF
jgi:hypothetical protein